MKPNPPHWLPAALGHALGVAEADEDTVVLGAIDEDSEDTGVLDALEDSCVLVIATEEDCPATGWQV